MALLGFVGAGGRSGSLRFGAPRRCALLTAGLGMTLEFVDLLRVQGAGIVRALLGLVQVLHQRLIESLINGLGGYLVVSPN